MKKLILTVALIMATGSMVNAKNSVEKEVKTIEKEEIFFYDCGDWATDIAEEQIADYWTTWFGAYGYCIKQR